MTNVVTDGNKLLELQQWLKDKIHWTRKQKNSFRCAEASNNVPPLVEADEANFSPSSLVIRDLFQISNSLVPFLQHGVSRSLEEIKARES